MVRRKVTLILLVVGFLAFGQTQYQAKSFPYRVAVGGLLTGGTTEVDTTLSTLPTGQYRVSMASYLQAVGTGGTWSMCVSYRNASSASNNTDCSATSNLTGTVGTTTRTFTTVIYAVTTTAITIIYNPAGATGTPNVQYAYELERLQ